jgi:hypothetical protein
MSWNSSIEQFWNISSTKKYCMAILPIGFGKFLPFGKSTTNPNNEWQSDHMQSTSCLIALIQDKVEGMSKIPDMTIAYAGH